MIESGKMRCLDIGCRWKGTEEEAIKTRSPFDPSEPVYTCPQCRTVESIEPVCDSEGCWDLATHGAMRGGIYRWSCLKHDTQHATA